MGRECFWTSSRQKFERKERRKMFNKMTMATTTTVATTATFLRKLIGGRLKFYLVCETLFLHLVYFFTRQNKQE